jgi:hypothetical protein
MTLTLSEGAVDAVRDYLIANMPAKIVDVNARTPDATVVEAPATYVIGEPELRAVKSWPICYVLTTGFEVANWNITPGAGFTTGEHTISAGIIVMDTNPERLQRRSWRSMLALYELIVEAGATPGNLNEFQLMSKPRVAYSATFISGKDYRLEGAVQFTLRRQELHQ